MMNTKKDKDGDIEEFTGDNRHDGKPWSKFTPSYAFLWFLIALTTAGWFVFVDACVFLLYPPYFPILRVLIHFVASYLLVSSLRFFTHRITGAHMTLETMLGAAVVSWITKQEGVGGLWKLLFGWLAIVIGTFLAILFTALFFSPTSLSGFSYALPVSGLINGSPITVWQLIAFEALGTYMIVLAVMVIDSQKTISKSRNKSAMAFGAVYALTKLVSPVTGGSFSILRYAIPAIYTGDFSDAAGYFVGPIIGTALGIATYLILYYLMRSPAVRNTIGVHLNFARSNV